METKDKASQEFLDQNQYTKQGILRYEKIFGRGFVSTGGLDTTEVLTQILNGTAMMHAPTGILKQN